MHSAGHNRAKFGVAGVLGMSLAVAPLIAVPAQANTEGTGVVISEAYLNGGSSGATYLNKFVELFNPTDAAISLDGMSVQYRSATGSADPTGVVALTGSIPANGHYLVQGTANSTSGQPIPSADATGIASFSGGGGTLFLANQATALTAPSAGSVMDNPAIIDLLGYGTSNTFEGTAATAASVTTSLNRIGGVDTDVNSADFTTAAPTPTNAAGETEAEPVDPVDPVEPGEPVAIAAIQGTAAASPLVGTTVTARGVVIADHSTGGYNGYYIQTEGSGGVSPAARTSSDGIFVFAGTSGIDLEIGDLVDVTGTVSEYFGLTQIGASIATVVASDVALPAVAPLPEAIVGDAREAYEGMLVAPAGTYRVASSHEVFNYGTLWLSAGDDELIKNTELVRPGVEAEAIAAANEARRILLDDGYSIQVTNAEHPGTQPYLTAGTVVRNGDGVVFRDEPYVLSYGFDEWRLQPTEPLSSESAADVPTFTSDNPRQETAPEVGGDLQVASFNVLNYFTTLASENEDARGAETAAAFAIQKSKIVAAINALDADVVALMEIENSAKFGDPVDTATADLVDGLNAAAGSEVWNYVATPDELANTPTDFITNAIIYKTASVELVGESVADIDETVWDTAREPIAQTFDADGETFTVIANHFKSKGSGTGVNADQGDGQGASNADRLLQAGSLIEFSEELKASSGSDNIFLVGDFNSYSQEDPMAAFATAGYVDLLASFDAGYTYSFDGELGSLDHVLASSAAAELVTDTAVWNINSPEWSDRQYNYDSTDPTSVFRSSDHDPILAGIDWDAANTVDLNLLNINDFHGRIDNNTVKFAGTIEQLRAQYGDDNTLLGSAGDNIGASVYASSSQKDVPTIEVLNALELQSSVGNHEFDTGFADLTGRIDDLTDWSYLGANVYNKGTTTPALQEYEIIDVAGVDVGVIGAVTEQTPSLVSQSGIATLDFGDPVEAVNRVAAELTDGNTANGEADVVIAEYHEGAGTGSPATLESQVALGGAFADIVNLTSASVDVIFTGHTHKAYAWDAPIPGVAGKTRPVLQTGSYGDNIGQVVLNYDPANDEVVAYTAKNVARLSVPPVTGATPAETAAASAALDAQLVTDYPRVAAVDAIVKAALAEAAVTGSEVIGSVTADITTAYSGTPPTRDDRGSESTLGNLVADSLLSTLGDESLGGAEIGVVNPGGLRAELFRDVDGSITVAEANAVLPFLNNLWTTTLTGAQFKMVLEQQWQRDAAGVAFTSGRTFQNLGLSDNVSYTYDPDATLNNHITSIVVNGEPIDMDRGYRIGSFNFLTEGGDNFFEFAKGTDARDSGLIDRDAWISYIEDNSPLSPSFDRRSVAVTGIPSEDVEAGSSVTLNLSKLDLTSLGSPTNTEVTAQFEGSAAAPVVFPVTAGAATVTVTVPDDVDGNATLVITATESGTTVRVPVAVGAAVTPGTGPGTGTPGTGTPGTGTPGTGTTGSGNGTTGSDLAFTGAESGPELMIGALLLLLGGALVFSRRRRMSNTEA